MNFRTEFEGQPSLVKIDPNQQILTIGSCFSQVVGAFLSESKFPVLNNPFGTVYNPISIFKLLKLAITNESPPEEGHLQQGEVHYHFDYHSDISALSKAELKEQINQKVNDVGEALKVSDWLIITFGTIAVYTRKSNGDLVANCHKVPQKEFDRRFLSIEQMLEDFRECYRALKGFNENLKLIVAVSPVRHTKESLVDNSYSKAMLRVFCNEITKKFEDVIYFPSFEIMMDDLRDYRFYGEDLIHPNKIAEEYILEKFSRMFFDAGTLEVLKEWKAVQRSFNHSPKHPETLAHRAFLKATLDSMHKLKIKLNIKKEIEFVESQIKKFEG
ncbi:MAG: GSCFA domain-containing protein [Bacteroidetes bacterium]|nr:GSCFA domain-containing protein [Bacteroidota bacterium]MDA1122197.1 GSCFA domain-containing protein [Bacteroidota bacterium]